MHFHVFILSDHANVMLYYTGTNLMLDAHQSNDIQMQQLSLSHRAAESTDLWCNIITVARKHCAEHSFYMF